MEHTHTRNMSFPTTGKVGDSSIGIEMDSMRMSTRQGLDSHRLLRGGRPPYTNSLTSREMESLTAICDTFLPSIESYCQGNESLHTFYRTSASMAGTPEYLGGYISSRLKHPALWLLRLAMWFLSTWYGTFVICGIGSLSTQFPYFQRFSQVLQHKREEIALSWSISSFFLYRMLFKAFKFLTLLFFFTQVNEKNENPSWEALGYKGPDPDFIRTPQDQIEVETEAEATHFGPLYKAIINTENPRYVISEALRKAGFPVSIRRQHLGKRTRASYPTIQCDAVVVGSGSGGGVVAGVLAKSGYKVLVLEKGNYYARDNLSLLEGPTMDQMYEGGGLLATKDLGVVVLAGSAVGGGSAVNWSASIRTPAHVTAEWCNKYELELFESKTYKQAMDVVCERMGVQSAIHEESLNNAVLRRGCLELGYPIKDIPRNSPPDHYCGWCCFGCKDGRKKGTHETWLVDLADSGKGVIIPSCKAVKVLHERRKGRKRNKATGVVFEIGNEWEKGVYVVESKVTVVACGTLGTPVLLKRSGLKNANIGKHLHLHPTVMAWGYFPETPGRWPGEEKKSYEGGIMTAMSTVVANFNTSGYGAVIQTPALHPGMFSVVTPWVSSMDIKERMSRFSRTAHIFSLARDKGEGQVNSQRSLSYQLDASDEENLKKGMEKMLRILAAAGAEEIGTHHCKGDRLNVKQVSSHEFERFVKEVSRKVLRDLSTPICSAHQLGSCRMGVDPKQSAVNQSGETWEVEGLYVTDASVFPTALGVNPMVTVQAIAYCTAQSILEVLARKKTG
ncbi:long-chain-alcohol oxidase FAO4A-like [Magnolia sinica]|uniref:long-chain-alcohol oxidase FAO4A-like n=1 Tax=Magnolia sinica TaxID=86752 RepID=UPI00265AC30F|nr:long-chain-alcohol oxidase FAO4A-like [Magnolia sinica]